MHPVSVFNSDITMSEYLNGHPLFLGETPGLFNTINKPYPKLWNLYKVMKSLDWDEAEFDFSQCNIEFKTCPKSVYEMMIRTLAWQWEADSVASTSITPILGNVITDSALWSLTQRIGDNESVHAATYSEIVRLSFDNPQDALREVLEVKESLSRLDSVAQVFSKLKRLSALYAAGESVDESELYDSIIMVYVSLLLLERLQFMASFAITFTICSTGLFQAIGKAIQKIAQDELEVHAETDKEVLRTELKTERGQEAFKRLKPEISKLFHDIVQSELTWTEYIFSDGRSLVGTSEALVKQWVLFNAREIDKFLDISSELTFPTKNPMPHLVDWINISSVQAAPQEQDNNQYKVNTVVRDDDNITFEVDF